MNALSTSLAVAAFVFCGSLIGLHLHRIVPGGKPDTSTQEVVRLATGMLSVLASLVLGLLIATAKTSSDNMDTAVRSYATELVLLDETLRDYGDDALPARRLLRDYTQIVLNLVWPQHGGRPFMVEDRHAGDLMEHVRESIRAVKPVDEGQRWLQEQALQIHAGLLRQRWRLLEQAGPSVRMPVIAIMVAWIVAIFISFGMNAPRNALVVGAFLVASLAIGSAIFLILQLDSPFAGMLHLPSAPMRIALSHMLAPGQ